MASAAEQLAANFNFSNFGKAKELRERILFTLAILLVARLGTYIPMPGIDPNALHQLMQRQQGGLLDIFNVLSGGAVSRMAIFGLGIMPYISASIILQLMQTVFPSLEALKKEGEAGRKTLNQYTRYGTVLLAAMQATGISLTLEHQPNLVLNPGIGFLITAVITLTGGTILLMWLGEQITSRGVGNGISLIIMVGIVARFPTAIGQMLEAARTGTMNPVLVIAFLVGAVGLVLGIVFMERAQRRLLVQYPKRQVGNRMFGGESSHLPLKMNVSGVIPPIFASSILLIPVTLAGFVGAGSQGGFSTILAYIGPGRPLYLVLYAIMIIFFAFFYTSIVFNPQETAENLKKYGGFIPGIRPGAKTADYIDFVLTR
ncbi:MAG: preprotein translocase subunit SecY, partial [Rhizomicrobium sp.]